MKSLFTPLLAVILAAGARAAPAPFDLAGPSLRATVTHGAQTLPIAQVPHLASGDRIWIEADLPTTQSTHYLMIAAFLSGSTNPPPKTWFFRCETWKGKCARDGLTIQVPEGAQQALVFLAPQTGGDFNTVVNAVRGRPGAFVRASQDLNQATLDRSRLEVYLSAIRQLNDTDPGRLKEAAPLLARSLAIKVDEKCLDRIPQLQAPCLMQGQESLILNDGHSTSIVEALTSGPAGDLAMEASYTPQLSYGYYSPYIASVLDIARIFDSFRTAQYQYIPALASPHADKLELTLNMAPSFNNPMSVLVVALPAVEPAQVPPLHAAEPKEIYCARKNALVLPVDGAPLVFSTAFAHDARLRLAGADGKSIELPAKADAAQGGFVVDTTGLADVNLGERVNGVLHADWGFDAYDGPGFTLANSHSQIWTLAADDAGDLIVGRPRTVHLRADSVSCVEAVMLRDADGRELRADWKPVMPDGLEIVLPLQSVQPGSASMLVSQYGAKPAQPVALRIFAEAGRLDRFTIHSGDTQGLLKGTRLDKVASLSISGIELVPGELSTRQGIDELPLLVKDPASIPSLKQNETAAAQVTLRDGRVLSVPAAVEAPRPRVTLLNKSVQPSRSSIEGNIQLTDPDLLPQDSKLVFSLRAASPPAFAQNASIEVGTADAAAVSTLSLGNGALTLENRQVAVATLEPAKSLGRSSFGPLQFRVLVDGLAGEWQPLATLVRLPQLKELKCPGTADLACKLSGSDLFLLDSVSGNERFENAVKVPDGFLGNALPVPHPESGRLYVRLRDEPAVIISSTLAAQELPSTQDPDRAAVRQSVAAEEAAGK